MSNPVYECPQPKLFQSVLSNIQRKPTEVPPRTAQQPEKRHPFLSVDAHVIQQHHEDTPVYECPQPKPFQSVLSNIPRKPTEVPPQTVQQPEKILSIVGKQLILFPLLGPGAEREN